MSNIFNPCDILLPKVGDMSSWSVIACDQFTSQPEYWQSVRKMVGDKPSTLNMILPEAELGQKDANTESEKIYSVMRRYLDNGVFKEYKNSFFYIERKLPNGSVRRGLIGVVDLEAYDWHDGCSVPIRATEDTVVDRLPPRIRIRERACLEMPHIIVFADDPTDSIMRSVKTGETLYDFELMKNGGHIVGKLVSDTEAVGTAISDLCDNGSMPMAIGDGNHSIAAAKKYWDSVKNELSPIERDKHPARYALAELENIHDPSIDFKPIHRVISKTDTAAFDQELSRCFNATSGTEVVAISPQGKHKLYFDSISAGEIIAQCEDFCKAYAEKYGGELDYIHGDVECIEMASRDGCIGLLMPRINKSELFESVRSSGAFPRKSFSIGEAAEKRYYLECRKIK